MRASWLALDFAHKRFSSSASSPRLMIVDGVIGQLAQMCDSASKRLQLFARQRIRLLTNSPARNQPPHETFLLLGQ